MTTRCDQADDPRRPSLAALRARVQKERHREIGNWLARHWARPTAVYGTWLAVRFGFSAHQVTLLALASGIAAATGFATGSRAGFVVGTGLAWLLFWLDHVDGQVARWRGTASLEGVYLDYLLHHVATMALGFSLGLGLAIRTGVPLWSIAGGFIAAGWTLLSLQNDCRYKALFQKLKRVDAAYLVEGGSGDRPAPAPPRPRQGLRAFAWPLYKACEPHVLLWQWLVLASLAAAAPSVWLLAWKAWASLMAVLAPILGGARVTRAITGKSITQEFDRWFITTSVSQTYPSKSNK